MRADIYLFTNGHVKSRQSAKNLILEGNILIDGIKITKASIDINDSIEHKVEILSAPKFVSRGGEKLDFALDKFKIDVDGAACVDIGASTGGFTDCLLQRGAGAVWAVDSGHGQLDSSIQSNTKVVSLEGYNARYMSKDDFGREFDLAVMDVSFISQTMIHTGVFSVLNNNGIFISLIKPQFECGRSGLNSHGIVKNANYRLQSIKRVIESALCCGFSCIDIIRSPIEGGSGNIEYLAYFRKAENPQNMISDNTIETIVNTK